MLLRVCLLCPRRFAVSQCGRTREDVAFVAPPRSRVRTDGRWRMPDLGRTSGISITGTSRNVGPRFLERLSSNLWPSTVEARNRKWKDRGIGRWTQRRSTFFPTEPFKQEHVQLASFGRLLQGVPDAIVGFRKELVEIRDASVLEASGEQFHPIVMPSDNPADTVAGMVFKITPSELAAADAYEISDYVRIETTLASGGSLGLCESMNSRPRRSGVRRGVE